MKSQDRDTAAAGCVFTGAFFHRTIRKQPIDDAWKGRKEDCHVLLTQQHLKTAPRLVWRGTAAPHCDSSDQTNVAAFSFSSAPVHQASGALIHRPEASPFQALTQTSFQPLGIQALNIQQVYSAVNPPSLILPVTSWSPELCLPSLYAIKPQLEI